MLSRRSQRENNRAKKIAKLNAQDIECEERYSFQEAREKKKTCDKMHYEANCESKKESMKRPNTGLMRKV